MTLPKLEVDARDRNAFIGPVPIARDTKTALDAIERAWRAKNKNLRGLVDKPGKKPKGHVPESSWYRWKTGESEPPFGELARLAQLAGCDLRLSAEGVIDGTRDLRGNTHVGGGMLKPETAEVVRLMDGLPDEARAAIRDAAFAANERLHASPPEAGEPQHGPSTRST